MNVATITMEPEQARARLKAYRAQMHRAAEGQYRTAIAAYEALADGRPVLSLKKAVQQGGVEPSSGLPRLAIARSDRKRVRCTWDAPNPWSRWKNRTRRVLFSTLDRHGVPEGFASNGLCIFVDMGREHGRTEPRREKDRFGAWRQTRQPKHLRGKTDVPLIPPEIREQVGKTALHHRPEYYVLWEVEKWETPKQKPQPPADPLLLAPLGEMPTDLFAVVAEWDLTDLERQIMESLK